MLSKVFSRQSKVAAVVSQRERYICSGIFSNEQGRRELAGKDGWELGFSNFTKSYGCYR
jgi:hypothetical protein